MRLPCFAFCFSFIFFLFLEEGNEEEMKRQAWRRCVCDVCSRTGDEGRFQFSQSLCRPKPHACILMRHKEVRRGMKVSLLVFPFLKHLVAVLTKLL